eukprot:1185378-Prorocentrum_minimum.AAC.1
MARSPATPARPPCCYNHYPHEVGGTGAVDVRGVARTWPSGSEPGEEDGVRYDPYEIDGTGAVDGIGHKGACAHLAVGLEPCEGDGVGGDGGHDGRGRGERHGGGGGVHRRYAEVALPDVVGRAHAHRVGRARGQLAHAHAKARAVEHLREALNPTPRSP